MAFTVGELAALTGITVRTLHHYDELGLVPASQRTAAGYRLYTERDVLRLHRVLVLRELGLSLEEIASAIDGDEPQSELLRRHREALVGKRDRLDAMIATLDAVVGGMTMSNEKVKQLFDGFDPSVYEDEVIERWGNTEAYQESARRTATYGPADWARYKAEAQSVGERLVALMQAGRPPDDPDVQVGVEAHRKLIDAWFYPCSVAMHKQLGAGYVTDPRFRANLDKCAPGYAQFLSDAIAAS
jgi:MerR family transcriptional regulator, thiopeptide resistance regulator